MASLRMRRVIGYDARVNDIVFHPPSEKDDEVMTLVFFAGDVQDYPEVMQAHRDNKNYLKWNLENMARMMHEMFPTHHVIVVKPSRVEYKSFSCYDNFVPSNNAGVPDHTPTHSALKHLERLLQSVTSRLKAMPAADLLEILSLTSMPEEIDIEELHNSIHRPDNGNSSTENDEAYPPRAEVANTRRPDDPLWWRKNLELDESRVTVIGFSKGCVVLNQFIYEFHYTKTLTPGDEHMKWFMSRIVRMYWLDGGHAGGKNTWITSRSLLETLTRQDIEIIIHVSPYQVQDEGRPWIGREEKTFSTLLTKLGAKVKRYLHNQSGSPHSLHMHFEVLANFKRVEDSTNALLPESSDSDVDN